MKKIFLDTNFIVDYLLRDEYKPVCQQFLAEAKSSRCKFYVTYLSVANFAYIARKLDNELLYCHLNSLCELFEVVKNDLKQIKKAINLQASDFEDALQYAAAKDAGCDCIITRNAKDFSFSDIPVMSATEYLETNNS